MRIVFEKYQGAGNDFVVIERRSLKHGLTQEQIALLCDRRFGVGADGLMVLEAISASEVEMDYFNADGLPAGLCGNGARCAAAWMKRKTQLETEIHILASDGPHRAHLLSHFGNEFRIRLKMLDQLLPQEKENAFFLNTGAPHHILFVDDPNQVDVEKEGARIRNSASYAPYGTNVNFVSKNDKVLQVRTFERGVEAETLACGTGAVAVALTQAFLDGTKGQGEYQVLMPGGMLLIRYTFDGVRFSNVSLEGPATYVFTGEILLSDNEEDRETQA